MKLKNELMAVVFTVLASLVLSSINYAFAQCPQGYTHCTSYPAWCCSSEQYCVDPAPPYCEPVSGTSSTTSSAPPSTSTTSSSNSTSSSTTSSTVTTTVPSTSSSSSTPTTLPVSSTTVLPTTTTTCPPNKDCGNGICCEAFRECCGTTCIPVGTDCCGDGSSCLEIGTCCKDGDNYFCMPVDSTCCGDGTYCPNNGNCCEGSNNGCCPAGQRCCGGRCCKPNEIYCIQGGVCSEVSEEELKGCCSTTKIFGEGSEEVALLRKYRDEILSKTQEGRIIIKLYYQWSPVVVKVLEEDALLTKYVASMAQLWVPPLVKAMEEDEGFREKIMEMIFVILPLSEYQAE